jgi:hypothetical protein
LPGRDTDKIAVFLREFKRCENNYDSPDPEKRFPNFVVMSMPEDHTRGTVPGAFTPRAMVANNDYAIGQLVDAVSHSRYWPNTAIFIFSDLDRAPMYALNNIIWKSIKERIRRCRRRYIASVP